MRRLFSFIFLVLIIYNLQFLVSGCGQIMSPTGGIRDSIPPKLINAIPKPGTVNFKGNKITLYFDEFVQIDQLQQNLLVSPSPKVVPAVDHKLRTVTIKLKDTLIQNTTYTISLGDAIRDLNEGNIFRNFTYVFSTGAVIDSMQFSGTVVLAETGKIDSSLIVLLYKNLSDSAVKKRKPDYIARLNGKGEYNFQNLAPGSFNVYALRDQDGSHIYNDKRKLFAFTESPVLVNANTKEVKLFAYAEQRENTTDKIAAAEKKLRYTSKIQTERQDILSPLIITFNKPLKNFDAQKLLLTDTLNNSDVDATITIDSSGKRISVKKQWKENESYKLIFSKDLSDSSGNKLTKADTIRFKTKKDDDYGMLTLNFSNLPPFKHPVIQFVSNNEVILSAPLTSNQWSRKLFVPGEYELRILEDENNNGIWDPGNYAERKQPEKVIAVKDRISVRGGGWENDKDIRL